MEDTESQKVCNKGLKTLAEKKRKLLFKFIFSNNQFTKKQTKILHFMMVFPVN